MNAASKWRPAWAVLAGYAPVSARLHLALFYFYGVYYHWAKRATGEPLLMLCPVPHSKISSCFPYPFSQSSSCDLCMQLCHHMASLDMEDHL